MSQIRSNVADEILFCNLTKIVSSSINRSTLRILSNFLSAYRCNYISRNEKDPRGLV